MKIILLKDISKVGKRYDVKDVASGYALNLLIPRGDAVAATPEALKRVERLKAAAEGERKLHQELLFKNLAGLDGATLTVSGKANERGHLFAGLHREGLAAELLKQTGLQIDPAMIELEHPIKALGEHPIRVNAEGKSVAFKLLVVKAIN